MHIIRCICTIVYFVRFLAETDFEWMFSFSIFVSSSLEAPKLQCKPTLHHRVHCNSWLQVSCLELYNTVYCVSLRVVAVVTDVAWPDGLTGDISTVQRDAHPRGEKMERRREMAVLWIVGIATEGKFVKRDN